MTRTRGEAVVVDPAYAIEQYLEEAARRDVRIVRVLETHTHADHVSGHGAPRARARRPGRDPLRSRSPRTRFEPLADGEEIDVGTSRLHVLHTPGHRPEHCCFRRRPTGRELAPLTGDSLFVGDAARPDLAVEAREGAEGLFHSLHRLLGAAGRRRGLPGPRRRLAVRRGHELRSARRRSAASGGSTARSRSRRWRSSSPTRPSISTPRPPNMERDRRAEPRAVPGRTGAARPSCPIRATRPSSTSGRSRASPPGTSPGAINVPVVGPSFATKAGFVVPAAASPVVLHASSPEEAQRGRPRPAVRRVLRRSRGYLARTRGRRDDGTRRDRRARSAARRQRRRSWSTSARRRARRRAASRQPPHPLPPDRGDSPRSCLRDRTVVTICESGAARGRGGERPRRATGSTPAPARARRHPRPPAERRARPRRV